jgi:UDP-N-acetylglucosamine--N-acetylmuramyl-(pentapeptide) pyrophosphoryl-undecaprenol N-acetylglucosamine transferase
MEAFPGTFASARAAHTGNPVRAEIIAIAPRAERMKRHPVGKRLLVLGGSQGARALNEAVPNALALLAQEAGKHKGAMNEEMQSVHAIEVWHQTGADKLNDTRAAYQRAGIGARVVPYIEHMHEAYAWADLVVCRAGAMTIAELSAVGLASILVPYPHAVDDHQTANARYLTAIGAAELMPECNLDNAGLAALLGELLSDPGRLQRMAEAARAAGQPRASELVAAICMEVAYA